MGNYEFTGDVAFKEKLIVALEKNELNGLSPYTLYWAGTAGSGWSFSVVQYDVANLGYGRDLLQTILLNARDTDGNYIIQDSNSSTGRIDDETVIDLLAKAQELGGGGLSSTEKELIDAALQSATGTYLIDQSYNDYFDNILFPEKVKPILDKVSAENSTFFQKDLAKIFIVDFSNQFGTYNVKILGDFVAGKPVVSQEGVTVSQQGYFGVDDLLNFYFRTNYAQTTKGLADELRRFGNIISQTGYAPADVVQKNRVREGLILY